MRKVNNQSSHNKVAFIHKNPQTQSTLNEKWKKESITELFELPFNALIFQAHKVHIENFDPNTVQLRTVLSINKADCSEDFGYCPR